MRKKYVLEWAHVRASLINFLKTGDTITELSIRLLICFYLSFYGL